MLADSKAFSGFSVDDPAAAQTFYANPLGLEAAWINEQYGMMELRLTGGKTVLVYASPNHAPASYTVLNFPVEDIESTVDGLVERGVEFIRYDGAGQDERGINRRGGPYIAWFADPAGNILSVLQER